MHRAFFPQDNSTYTPWGEFDGLSLEPSPDVPDRLTTILKALNHQDNFPLTVSEPTSLPSDQALSVHSQEYLHFLVKASSEAKTHVVGMPSVFPTSPINVSKETLGFEGLLGTYLFDTSTPIMGNTYSAALNSAACALEAARCVCQGDNVSLALCRPPGHHAGPSYGGGYCFLNNAAMTSAHLQSEFGKVALIDLDFHHGNGSQDIFYDSNQVLYVSIHGHPEINFPYYWGFAEERGTGAGKGFNYNFPLREGSSGAYLKVLETALAKIAAFKPGVLVLSAGFDTYWKDPLGDFSLDHDDFTKIGQYLTTLRIPIVVVLEGGYYCPALGKNFLELIKGIIA